MKVSEIVSDLPPETLRRIDGHLCWEYGKRDRYICKQFLNNHRCKYCDDAPYFTTSIDAALELCEKVLKEQDKINIQFLAGGWWVEVCGYAPFDDYGYVESDWACHSEKGNKLSALPCAIIRALLRSQNVSDVEV